MTNTGRYQVTFLGNGIVRLPRAGIFQTGTRAVVDETIARIAVAHGSFHVVPMSADAIELQPPAPPPPQPQPQPQPQPAQAAPEKGKHGKRQSQAMRAVAAEPPGAHNNR